jgi:hypothetical protein
LKTPDSEKQKKANDSIIVFVDFRPFSPVFGLFCLRRQSVVSATPAIHPAGASECAADERGAVVR